MGALVHEGLLDELIKRLHVLVVDDVGQHSQSVGFDHFRVSHLDVLAEAGNHDKDLLFIYLQFLNEDVYESPEVLVEGRVGGKQFSDVKEHGALFKVREILALVQQKDDFVQQISALLVIQLAVVENL